MKTTLSLAIVFSLCALCLAGCQSESSTPATSASAPPATTAAAPAAVPGAAAPANVPAGTANSMNKSLNDPNVPADVKEKIRQNMPR